MVVLKSSIAPVTSSSPVCCIWVSLNYTYCMKLDESSVAITESTLVEDRWVDVVDKLEKIVAVYGASDDGNRRRDTLETLPEDFLLKLEEQVAFAVELGMADVGQARKLETVDGLERYQRSVVRGKFFAQLAAHEPDLMRADSLVSQEIMAILNSPSKYNMPDILNQAVTLNLAQVGVREEQGVLIVSVAMARLGKADKSFLNQFTFAAQTLEALASRVTTSVIEDFSTTGLVNLTHTKQKLAAQEYSGFHRALRVSDPLWKRLVVPADISTDYNEYMAEKQKSPRTKERYESLMEHVNVVHSLFEHEEVIKMADCVYDVIFNKGAAMKISDAAASAE